MLPDAAWHCGAFVLADEVVTITMLDAYGRDALQANLAESIDEGVDNFSSFVILIPIIVFYILFFCFSRVFTYFCNSYGAEGYSKRCKGSI